MLGGGGTEEKSRITVIFHLNANKKAHLHFKTLLIDSSLSSGLLPTQISLG